MHTKEATRTVYVTQAEFTSTPPFSLAGIIFTGVLMSMLGAGIMAAVNWRRLGREDRFWPTLFLSMAALVLFVFLAAWLPLPAEAIPLVVAVGFNPGFVLLLARWQRADYLAWVAANRGVRPRLTQSGCSAYITILVGSFLLGGFLWGFVTETVVPLGLSLRPQHTFTGDNLTLSYPGSWFPLEFNPGVCNVAGTDCLLAAAPLSQDFSMDVIRFRALLFPYVLEQFDKELWLSVQLTRPGTELESHEELEVDGRRAIRRIVNVSQGSETWMFLLIQDGSAILRIMASGTASSFIQHRQALEAMIESIHFTQANG
jgi:hypothetical protein